MDFTLVALRRQLPSKTLACEDTLYVSHLRQEAGPYAPLHDVTLCLHRREVVSVLGPTGCGKSLLLEVLAGRHLVTDGNAYLLGLNLFMHTNQVRLLPDGRRPGVDSGALRKLSMSLAVLGAPQVLLLDNPTQHLDPVSRKRLWHTIITFVKKTHASVLIATDE
ncbi:ATP binding cassette (ABC) transporter, putative [Ixodes scapularis]|uniref:ATP binding cassette (ABC) transporter, putative n=1 Tax=Ixodes scapularis TaxID=6945 RepID=B7PCT8_IXOSC|nr:ATP binding cassette (ABC) transporter, putative [Ixodes scapularis]|eukprot:XP_002410273.1 ATP binding cassette (ABC) transporter, putative [Ixodes scapularis]